MSCGPARRHRVAHGFAWAFALPFLAVWYLLLAAAYILALAIVAIRHPRRFARTWRKVR
jgi:hypothetical protein